MDFDFSDPTPPTIIQPKVLHPRVLGPRVSESDWHKNKGFGILAWNDTKRPECFKFYSAYEDKDLAAALPFSMWDPTLKCWHLPPFYESLRHLSFKFPEFRYTEKALAEARKIKETGKFEFGMIRALKAIKDGKIDVSGIEGLVLPLRPLQQKCVAFIERAWAENYGVGNFWEQGLGKTCIALVVLDRYFAKNPGATAVIFAPLGTLMMTWVKEVVKFTRHLRPLSLGVKRSMAKRAELLEDADEYDWTAKSVIDGITRTEFIKIEGRPNVFLVNHDAGSSKDEKGKYNALIRALIDLRPTICIVDEAHLVSRTEAARTRAVREVAYAADYRMAMTGTPGKPENYFGLLSLIDERIMPMNKTTFMARYVKEYNTGTYSIITGYNNLPELHKRTAQFSYRVKQEEAGNIPREVYQTQTIELDAASQKAYDEAKNKTLAHFRDNAITNVEVESQFHTLRRLTGGHFKKVLQRKSPGKPEIAEYPRLAKMPKLEWLLESLETELLPDPETGAARKAVIAVEYKEDVVIVGEALKKAGIDVVLFHGDVPTEERQENQRRFLEDPKCQVLLGLPSTFGTGFHLVPDLPSVCDIMYIYSIGYKVITYQQLVKRIVRDGQTRVARIIALVCLGTLDEAVMDALTQGIDICDICTGDNIRRLVEGSRAA